MSPSPLATTSGWPTCRRPWPSRGPALAWMFVARPLRPRSSRCPFTGGLIRNEGKGVGMPDLSGMRFAETHEWFKQDGATATVGISESAQSQLGDVIYLELPTVGQQLDAGARLGVIESVKAASDLYSPVGGEVTEINRELTDHPEYVNQDPYGKGWIIKLRAVTDNPKLLDRKAYDTLVQGQSH